ncbi:MAG TPA: hypothetical protein ENN51_01950 [candidate division WOR-3 bacterium]|uniref:Uncharacterized protein n=1 Tax=candidate division WOR-3 bacterium TaxID=2052148 RepID=A0A7V0T4G1_UNCW3|nr:hypothetical protein [candidate division WOR-3 bacterium]
MESSLASRAKGAALVPAYHDVARRPAPSRARYHREALEFERRLAGDFRNRDLPAATLMKLLVFARDLYRIVRRRDRVQVRAVLRRAAEWRVRQGLEREMVNSVLARALELLVPAEPAGRTATA